MIEKDTCYFCTSPFQLYAIIALSIEREEKADLYIDPQFSDADKFAERIKQMNIFDSIHVIDSQIVYKKYLSAGPGLRNHIQIVNTYFHVKDIAQMILLPEVEYKNMFVSSKAYLPRMVQLYFLKIKRNVNMFYFDDGAGTYCDDRAYKINRLDRFIRRLLFGKKAIETNHKKYVFSPEIYKALNKDTNVERICRIWADAKGKEIMNRIFGYSGQICIDENVIILDQPRDELFDEEGNKKINNMYKMFVNQFGTDDVVLKKHPRSREESIGDIRCMGNTGIPFEVFCMNMDMNDKIIVTYSSTAAATPKILFDQEPTVFVLSKIIPTIKGEKNLFEPFYRAVQNSYIESKRVCLPESFTELRENIT